MTPHWVIKFSIKYPIFILAMTLLPHAAKSDCSEVLLASRNYLSKIDVSDLKSDFYDRMCRSESKNFGASYSDLQSVFGFKYSSKDEFCEAQNSNYANHDYKNLQTSTFVEKALESYNQCLELQRRKISTKLKISKDRIIVDFERTGSTPGIIHGWRTNTDKLKCQLLGPNAPDVKAADTERDFQYAIPTDEQATVYCPRTAVSSSSGDGVSKYPEVELSVFTSEGNFTARATEEPIGKERWAEDVAAKLELLQQKLETLGGRKPVLDCMTKPFKSEPSTNFQVSAPALEDYEIVGGTCGFGDWTPGDENSSMYVQLGTFGAEIVDGRLKGWGCYAKHARATTFEMNVTYCRVKY